MKISGDYTGGNIKLLSVDGGTVKLEQELRGTTQWWFYWNFRVEGAQGKNLVFEFQNGEVVCPFGPAVSDDGYNWSFNGQSCYISGTSFKYGFSESEKIKYFAFSLPYQLAHFDNFFKTIANNPEVERKILTYSEQDREIPLVKIGCGTKNIIFTCRHHCCESTASYALEGLISSIVKEYSVLLDNYTFHIIPFVDIDGVENGDQGKDRAPHDHNRDYIENPIYNYTRAIYRYTENMPIAVFIDFHSPFKWGGLDNLPHIHFGPQPADKPELQLVFADNLYEITNQNPVPDTILYNNCRNDLFYGGPYNKVGTPSSKNYFALKKNVDMAFTIETPYSGNTVPYTVCSLQSWGRSIMSALYKTIVTQ